MVTPKTIAKSVSNNSSCNSVPGMTSELLSLCQNSSNFFPSVSQGAVMAIKEFQRVFHRERWDCSTVKAFLSLPLVFSGVLQGGLCTVHTYTNFNMIEYDFVYLENLNNIFINFVVNHT